ncbi:MAG TPA: GC-type dockerin domain-anchored protein [Phycisphaerales bacterium]|nr:GC-type dockerin domain-anchored protein [Phycisphaerales bacterium]
MKAKLFILALTAAAGSAYAQNSIVSDIPGTFVDISTMAGVNALVGGDTDDAFFQFSSTVNNVVFASTDIRVTSNGYILFGGAGGSATFTNATINSGTASPVAPVDTQALFPYWDDQYIRPGNGGNIHWIEGAGASFGLPASVGNVLIIQWTAIDHYFDSADVATYQVQIFQNPLGGTVAAQMLYPDVNFGDAANYDNGVSATIGFASGTTGGPLSLNNVLHSFNTADAVTDGTVLSLTIPTGPVPPSGLGSTANGAPGSVVLRVTTASGINPPSTGITVSGDLTSLGGGASVAFVDNGSNGDATAGDGVYSTTVSFPAGTVDGTAYTVPFTVADAQGRSSSGNIGFLADIAGQSLATAATPAGSGALDSIAGDISVAGDADIYRINICDNANFSATTVGNGTAGDTQLFLFNLDGTGVTFNDDSTGLLSTITGQFVTATGDYLLAIARYDNDPQDAGALPLWIDTPYAVERQPDGAGSASPFDTWTGGGLTGAYTITLTGACFSEGRGNVCGAADLGSVGGVAPGDNHLDNNDFVVFIDFFFAHNPLADQGSTGGVPGPDNVWDNNDFVVFIDNFFTAPASCR